MNPKLLGLLAVMGTAIVGGVSFTMYVARDGVTDAQLIDAGAEACADVTLSCLVKSTQAGVCIDSGGNPMPAGSYCQLEVNGKNCGADAGVFPFPDVFDGGAMLLSDPVGVTCVTTANGKLPAGQKKKLATFFCACAPNPNGTCQWNGQSGTLFPGTTFASGTWTGSCQPKSCIVVPKDVFNDAGQFIGTVDDSWPANCPP